MRVLKLLGKQQLSWNQFIRRNPLVLLLASLFLLLLIRLAFGVHSSTDSLLHLDNGGGSSSSNKEGGEDLEQDDKSSSLQLEGLQNVHVRLHHHIAKISNDFTQSAPRRFSRFGIPHFTGGWQQFRSALEAKNWTYHVQNELMTLVRSRNQQQPVTSGTNEPVFDLVFSSCLLETPNIWALKRQRTIGAVSGEPSERKVVLKGNFYLATRAWFASARPGCDYRTFHPETHLLASREDCFKFDRNSVVHPGELWFLKQSSRLSFGLGITLLTSENINSGGALDCDKLRFGTPLLMQKGVQGIYRHNNQITQGRGYLLVSSYDPTRAWFFMGYFNVAQPDSHITNSGKNQRSDRLTFAQLMQGRSEADLKMAKHNIKVAAQQLFHVLNSEIKQDKHSFSLFGFDYVVREEDLSVNVLEANCNCELFSNAQDFGPVRYQSSTNLVRAMMDIVIASNLAPEAFDSMLAEFLADNEGGAAALSSLEDSNELDKYGVRSYWELLYSQSPPYSYAQLGPC